MNKENREIFSAEYLRQVKQINDRFETLMSQTRENGCADSHFLLKLAYHSFCQDIYHQIKDK